MTYATRIQRLIAQIVDQFIALVPLGGALLVARMSEALGTLIVLLAVIWVVFYLLMSDGFPKGQSYGKKALGIRVVDEKLNPRALSHRTSGMPCEK